jgi:hypothetical protein
MLLRDVLKVTERQYGQRYKMEIDHHDFYRRLYSLVPTRQHKHLRIDVDCVSCRETERFDIMQTDRSKK